MKYLLLILLFYNIQAQPTLSLSLHPIKHRDTVGFRVLEINYSISNNSKDTITIFLDNRKLCSYFESALRPTVCFSIFEKNKRTKLTSLLKPDKANFGPLTTSDIQIIMNKSPLYLKKIDYLKNILLTITPGQTLKFQNLLYWNYNRYFREEEFEYYLNESKNFELLLEIHCLEDELFTSLSEPEKNELILNRKFYKGWITSNPATINFQ